MAAPIPDATATEAATARWPRACAISSAPETTAPAPSPKPFSDAVYLI
jgi:hypothetical protein